MMAEALFLPQSDHGVNAGRSPGRDEARDGGRCEEHQGTEPVRRRVEGLQAEELAPDEAREAERGEPAEPEAHGRV